MSKAVALVGGAWGSEAKGLVAYQLADQFGVHIRTGGANAGHTFFHNGEKFVARSIPCGWVNPDAEIVIGPGAVIDVSVLKEELEYIESKGYSVRSRLWIDGKAGIITEEQHHFEGGVDGYAHQKIGSTGEGVGISRIARINRRSLLPDDPAHKFVSAAESEELAALGLDNRPTDTVDLVNYWYDYGDNILLEGTQGSGLSLIHGVHPFTTSADTNSGQLAVDAGISPSLIDETILVCRTYPIRVAGNSGPMGKEISFADLGVPEETTTVTKKVRRIAEWNDEVVARAVTLNRPAKIVLTFMNYKFPELTYGGRTWADLTRDELDWIEDVEYSVGAPVVAVSYDPVNMIVKPGELNYLA